jgi:hypothetical protein
VLAVRQTYGICGRIGVRRTHSININKFGEQVDSFFAEGSMSRILLAGGLAAALMGASLSVPVVVAWLERGRLTGRGIGFLAAAAGFVAVGVTAAVLGGRRGAGGMPAGVRAAVAANALFLAFLSLELSDRAVRQEGKLFYWTTFLLPPALVLFGGLLAARRWSWWAARGAAALGVLWFLAFLAVIPIAPLQSNGVPAPWYGRLYAAGVTLAFAGVFAAAFRALGREETRSYFQDVRAR